MIELKEASVVDIARHVLGSDATRPDIRKCSSMFRYRLEQMLGLWLDYDPIRRKYKLRDFVIGPGKLFVDTPHGIFRLESDITIVSSNKDDEYVVEHLSGLELLTTK